MKKILYSILLVLFVLCPIKVFAEGYVSASPGYLTIEQGSSQTFRITAYNTIGDVSIRSNNSSVAAVNIGEWGTGMVDEKQTKTGVVTVTGNSVGTTTITLIIDAATFDGEDLAGQTRTVTVNVVAKPTPTPTPIPTPSPRPNPPSNSNNKPGNNLSRNNNIKNLSIDGYQVVKVDNNNYTLTVANNVSSVNIKAEAEDKKSQITGLGVHELQIGENNIELVIASESGEQNKINIKVTRKSGYYLEDLDAILKDRKINDVDIIINADSKLSKEDINKIKKSKKIVRLNYYDENKKLLYSWIINGSKIKDSEELATAINYTAEHTKAIYRLSNYADGLYINFDNIGNIPAGTKIKLYVGDKFKDGNIVNLYYYNDAKETLDFIKSGLKVVNGYIEYNIEQGSEYFVTMSTIPEVKQNETSSINIFVIFVIIELIIIISLVTFIFKKIKPLKKDSNIEELQSDVNVEVLQTDINDFNNNINNNVQ